MYVAKHFELPQPHVEKLLATVRPGNLVTTHETGPMSTFVPFHLERRGDEQWLVTHLVKNNPQAREPVSGPALVLLDIADAYVSPHMYATNEALPNVPTWDYVTIHAWGEIHFDRTPEGALRAAKELTLRMEQREVLDVIGEAKLLKMARAIVSAEIKVERIQAKAKLSQNRHPDDVRSLLEHLTSAGHDELARYVREIALPYAEARFEKTDSLKQSHRSVAITTDPKQSPQDLSVMSCPGLPLLPTTNNDSTAE
ncbi:MAG: FMN-binding protein [Propionibacterium sp.]|nr:MAG: FMN-binding protein [Propionibacterium sp.]